MKDIFFEGLDDWNLNGSFFLSAFREDPPIIMNNEEVREAFYHQDEEEIQGDEDGPNAAWAWASGNMVEIRCGAWKKKDLRSWGYVFGIISGFRNGVFWGWTIRRRDASRTNTRASDCILISLRIITNIVRD